MDIFNKFQKARLGLIIILSVLSGVAWAEDMPDTQSMINSLKPVKTRSLRNLLVKPAGAQQSPADEAAAEVVPPVQTGTTHSTTDPQPAHAAISEPVPSLSLAIQFDLNSAQVSSQSQQALSRLATALRSDDLRSFHFLIEGHTDAKGAPAYNRKLSQQRADAVKQLLVAQGVNEMRLSAIGKGSDEPVNRKNPFAAENRRVRVVNIDSINP
ncbi:OmpA family protein [Neisseriaceae bacterium JH1-16]|nr:OmpA family protein [Neisseriaceae bacterium JH1-16]